MKKTINQYEFIDTMRFYGFSYDGCVALLNHYKKIENDMGYEVEFDPIEISDDFTEYSSIDEYNARYESDFKTIEEIEEHCLVIEHTSGFLCAN